jgi:sugar/nucleoside kinase (ribokinase family)
MGAGGALACTGGTVVTSPSFHADVVDTVGAGDAFNAGFLLARGEGADLGVCLQWGNAVAAIAIAERGARSLPMRTTVEQLIESGRTTKEP